MALTNPELVRLYRRRARHYDMAVRLYPLAGLFLPRYRRRAVAALRLQPGDTVVDLGCGTGLNLPSLQAAVGPAGHIVGVDLTDAMLERARERVARAGWHNVQLIQADMADYTFPPGLGGVLSTTAITLVPAYDVVVRRAAEALRPGGRLVICDLKRPDRWPEWLVRFAVLVNRPFGVRLDLADRHPWESVRRSLAEVEFQELYFGAMYICVGERRSRAAPDLNAAGVRHQRGTGPASGDSATSVHDRSHSLARERRGRA